MKIHIQLVSDPIPALVPPHFPEEGLCGSEVEFRGKIRQDEKGAAVTGLFYEAYEKMARHQIENLLLELNPPHPCLSVELIHRLGWVPVNEASIFIRVRSSHRREGFQMLAAVMDRLKKDVPIWKSLL